MFFPVAPIFLAAQLIIGVADEVPRFNIDANCDAEAAASAGIALSQSAGACKQDEQNAHDQLVKQWAQFRPSDRVTCVALASEGDAHSYVELLTCLEMANDARTLQDAK
jgi:hypothetical protein